MQSLIKYFLILILMCGFNNTAQSQSIKDRKVSELTDAQIDKIADYVNKKGLTLQQAKNMARAQGASEIQISELESRLSARMKMKTSSSKTAKKKSSSKKSSSRLEDEDEDEDLYLETSSSADDNDVLMRDSFKEIHNFTLRDSLIFGFSLFNNNNLSFEPNANRPVSDEYVLGPGDGIQVDIWGNVQASYSLMVSRTGTVTIPLVGTIHVAGQHFTAVRTAIHNRLKQIYSDLDNHTSASISISNVRTINVSVIGEVFMPGTYTISGASSLFNILYLCGGPNINGSYRNIQLLREGKIVSTLDVYDYLIEGNTNINVPVLDGDVILVPTYQKRITIEGAFKRIGFFEAKEGETTDDMIRYAGGFLPNANTNSIELTRFTSKGREFVSFKEGSAIPMISGDNLNATVYNSSRTNNYVYISGSVFCPGNYQFKDDLKLSDLLSMAGGITENAFTNRGVITRTKPDFTLESFNFNVADVVAGNYDTKLCERDSVLITSFDNVYGSKTVTILGAVAKPDTILWREGLTVSDLILMAGGITDEASLASVEIFRRLPAEQADTASLVSGSRIHLSLSRDFNRSNDDNNVTLLPYDIVTIPQTPASQIRGTVEIRGEVLFQGKYELLNKDETIADIVKRAGGLTPNAHIKGARLYRIVTNDPEALKAMELQEELFNTQDTKIGVTSANKNGTHELVAIDIEGLITDSKKMQSFHLLPGDHIVIPSNNQMETVRISGAVLAPNSIAYDGVTTRQAIRMAGGFAPKAKRSKTYVIYPNGKAVATKNFLWFHKYPELVPGAEIIVPERVERQRLDVPTIVSTIATSVSSFATLMVLILRNNN